MQWKNVPNADNSGLEPLSAGAWIIGAVDEVNGEGAEEMSFAPTRHELLQLAKYWAEVAWDIEFGCWCLESVGSSETRRESFAWRRVDRIATLLGEGAIEKALEEARGALEKRYPAFKTYWDGTDEERQALRESIDRALGQPPDTEGGEPPVIP